METTHILCEVEDSSVELQVSTCKVCQLYTQRVGKVLSQEAPPHAVVGISHIHVICCIVCVIYMVVNDKGTLLIRTYQLVHGLPQFIITWQPLQSNILKIPYTKTANHPPCKLKSLSVMHAPTASSIRN